MGNILLTIPEFCFTDWQVCLLGIGTVFVGLIGVILVCSILGAVVGKIGGKEKESEPTPPTMANTANEEIPNREEFVAAVSAALAEYMGDDINSFRIVSIKKI